MPPGVLKILGFKPAFRSKLRSGADLRSRILEGLPYAAAESVMLELDLDRVEMSSALNVSRRTLSRRKDEKRLQPDESDRLYRVARIAARAEEVFGGKEKAAAWLRRANRALGGDRPLALVRTDLGTLQVEEVLGRIEHGVAS